MAAAGDRREREADAFAEGAIAGADRLRAAGLIEHPTPAGAEALASALRVHPALAAVR